MGLGGAGVVFPAGRFQPQAWVFAYSVDWGFVVKRAELVLGYVTILRWFGDVAVRQRQLTNFLAQFDEEERALPPQLEVNLRDLFDIPGTFGPWVRPGPFLRFVHRLGRGDLVVGGPSWPEDPPAIARIRPGYAFFRWAWIGARTEWAPPLPFWVFPRAEGGATRG